MPWDSGGRQMGLVNGVDGAVEKLRWKKGRN